MSASMLYLTTILIWGTTWLAITYQLGNVDPLWSVAYRFVLAGTLLFLWLMWRKQSLRFNRQQQGLALLQGLLLFAINYWLFYGAEQWITSGLVAVLFSLVVYMNSLNAAIFLRQRLNPNVWLGASLGLGGLCLIFWPELMHSSASDEALFWGIVLGIAGTLSASLGNVASAYNQQQGMPLMLTNAYGMLYGGLSMAVLGWVLNIPMTFDWSVEYVGALVYLAVFGSILAFGSYLKLIGLIGADKAAYVAMLIPIVALLVSSLFEGYIWTWQAILGLSALIAGHFLTMKHTQKTS